MQGPYIYPLHVRASMLPKKETKYSYNAFQARDRRDKSEYDSAVYSSLHGTQGCHLVFFNCLIPKMPQNTNIFIWQLIWNMISPVIFAGALTIFPGALPPWAPPWWRGPSKTDWRITQKFTAHIFLCTYTIQAAKGHDFRFVSSARHKTCSIGLNMHLELWILHWFWRKGDAVSGSLDLNPRTKF